MHAIFFLFITKKTGLQFIFHRICGNAPNPSVCENSPLLIDGNVTEKKISSFFLKHAVFENSMKNVPKGFALYSFRLYDFKSLVTRDKTDH